MIVSCSSCGGLQLRWCLMEVQHSRDRTVLEASNESGRELLTQLATKPARESTLLNLLLVKRRTSE